MKHQSPEQMREAAAVFATPAPTMTRKDRLERWADLLDAHGGPLEALRRIEYLTDAERRAYRGTNTPLNVAYADPVLRRDGLGGDTLGDSMDYFEMNAEDAHHLLCDCHYMGSLTGHGLAARLRRYAGGGGVMAWARSMFSGHTA